MCFSLGAKSSSGNTEMTIRINEISSKGSLDKDENGDFDDWVEVYNYGVDTIDLIGMYFTDDPSELSKFRIDSSIKLAPNSFQVMWLDNDVQSGKNHLGFKLSKGEKLVLSYESQVIDSVTTPELKFNTTFGLDSNGDWKYFSVSSFAKVNNSLGFTGILSNATASHNSGSYSSGFSVTLDLEGEVGSVYYTLDGSQPSSNSLVYVSPFSINSTTVLKFKTFKDSYISSDESVKTYVFNSNETLAELFISTSSTNIRSSSDTKVQAELVDENGEVLFSKVAGSQSHGDSNQKSFKLFFRSEYGSGAVEKILFPYKNDVKGFKRLVFRKAGNDGLSTSGSKRAHFRDGFISRIANSGDFNFKASGYRPVSVYINGQYDGVYNMRERIDKFFIENNYGVDDDEQKCFMEYRFGFPGNLNEIEGSMDYFRENASFFAQDEDMSEDANFDILNQFVDVADFSDYWMHEVYVGNFDWLSNNMYFWSTLNREVNQFHWILWDTDIGMGFDFGTYGNADWNSLEWSSNTKPGRGYSGSRTRLIRGLLENDSYKEYFITRFCDLINSEYHPTNLKAVLNEIVADLEPEIPKHIGRWGVNSVTNWGNEIQVIEDYINARPDYVRGHIKEKFNLGNLLTVDVESSIPGGGTFKVNTIKISDDVLPWSGKYFNSLPFTITAIPKPGYRFVEWQNLGNSSTVLNFVPEDDLSLVAIFEKDTDVNSSIVINEISYKQFGNPNSGDWIELFNGSSEPIDLSQWVFSDESDNEFLIPEGYILEPNDYLVLTEKKDKFLETHVDVINVLGDFDFGLKKRGEQLTLQNAQGKVEDFLSYKDTSPWPELTDQDNTIELMDFMSDNSFGENWELSSVLGGTPGKENGTSVIDNLNKETENLVSLFPNPASKLTYFTSAFSGEAFVFDMQGALKLEMEFVQGKNRMNVSELQAGVYLVKLVTDNGENIVKQLVVN